MPMQVERILADLLAAANGEIVGKIRFQKIIYLLDQLGLNSGVKFSYYHYGPYAEQVSNATMRARFIDGSIDESEVLSSYGGSYSVFKLLDTNRRPENVGELSFDRASKLIAKMKSKTSVELELAATIHWLVKKENVSNWRNELSVRKPNKASTKNTEQALLLLQDLGLTVH